jgi:phosphoesterase RecJ-like protein
MTELKEIRDLLSLPKNVVITSHRNPDGDAVGSSLAMAHYLQKNNHHVKVILPSEYPENLYWMSGIHDILVHDTDENEVLPWIERAEVFFCLDFNSLDRIDKIGEAMLKNTDAKVVMIDHHLYPEGFADYVFSDPTASSTCELVHGFIKDIGDGALIDEEIGNCLYTGIVTDTGSFKYSTSARLFRVVAELLEKGVDDYKVQDLLFNSLDEKQLRLLGHCLNNRMELLPEFGVGILTLTKEDYANFDIKRGDTEGIVNYLLRLKNIDVAAFIMEQPTIVKISLRSKDDISVQEIAQKHFRGGGHKNASGGASFHNLTATVNKFKEILPLYFQKKSSL